MRSTKRYGTDNIGTNTVNYFRYCWHDMHDFASFWCYKPRQVPILILKFKILVKSQFFLLYTKQIIQMILRVFSFSSNNLKCCCYLTCQQLSMYARLLVAMSMQCMWLRSGKVIAWHYVCIWNRFSIHCHID